MKKKYFAYQGAIFTLAITIVVTFISVSQCLSQTYIDSIKVPAGYNPSRHILLVAEMPRLNNPEERNKKVTEKLDKALQEYCPYKYVIVSPKDIFENKTLYGDTSVYKYAILNTLNILSNTTTTIFKTKDQSGKTTKTSTVAPTARTTYIDFGFYDRVEGIRYANGGNASTYISKTVEAFIAVIKKEKGK